MRTANRRLVLRGRDRLCGHARERVNSLSLDGLSRDAEEWLIDCDIRQLSPTTIALRRTILDKLQGFLREDGHSRCDAESLCAFFDYRKKGHKRPGGRWGNPQLTRPTKPRTVEAYYLALKILFTRVRRSCQKGHDGVE